MFEYIGFYCNIASSTLKQLHSKIYQYFVSQKNAIANLHYDLPSFKYGLNTIALFYDRRVIEYLDLNAETRK